MYGVHGKDTDASRDIGSYPSKLRLPGTTECLATKAKYALRSGESDRPFAS
jgi:hypothetical protein